MNNQKNLAAIGVFVIVGLILSISGIVALTSSSLFSKTLRGVTFFNESVTGLNIGAPTKFKGVVIGKVVKIGFQRTASSNQSWIRVEFEVDINQAVSLGAYAGFDTQMQISESINRGLRANLATESMVTGIRYIELEYSTNAPEPIFFNENPGFIEIPSRPSALAGLAES
ncbi:MAG: MCE family protein, partial [Bacteroidetes bacterium]